MSEPTAKRRKLTDLVPDLYNANKGTERGLRMLDDSLREDGAGRGILLDRHGNVIAGNKTLERAVDQGFEEIIVVPTDGKQLVATQRVDIDLDSEQGRRMALRDNRIAQVDLEWSAEELQVAADSGVDLKTLWNDEELAALLKPEIEPTADPGAQMDKAAELQQKWQVQPGDLWQIGRHRLLCGDSTQAADVARVMGGEKAQGVFTSPPYAEQRKDQYGGVPADEYVDWWEAVQANARQHLKSDASFFLNIKPHCEEVERSLYVMDLVLAMRRRWRWSYIDEFCWLRAGVPKMVKYHFKNAFEPIYQFAVNARDFKFRPQSVMHYSENVPQAGGAGVGSTNWAGKQGRAISGVTASRLQGYTGSIFGSDSIEVGMAYPSNVVKAYRNTEALGHAAAFPVELPEFFILAYSDVNDIWFDPFIGSGTVFVAAQRNERAAVGIEKLPDYCAVILERLSAMGLTPERG